MPWRAPRSRPTRVGRGIWANGKQVEDKEMASKKPLAGLTVIEAVSPASPAALSLAARMCGRIACDLGAAVVRLAPAGGAADPARDCFLDVGKTVVPVAPDGLTARLADFGDADCLVVDVSFAEDLEGRDRGPGVVLLAMSLDDPLGGSEFTVEARSGLLDLVGEPDRAPLRLGGHQIAYASGLAAYLAVIDLCASRGPEAAPSSRRVDLLDVAVWLNWKAVGAAALGLPVPTRMGAGANWVVVPCRDGYVALVYRSVDWDSLKRALGDSRLDAPGLATEAGRQERRGELNALMASLFGELSRAEIRRMSMAHRIPLGPIWTPAELRDDPHMLSRVFFQTVDCDGKTGALPSVPVKWNGTRFAPAGMRPDTVR